MSHHQIPAIELKENVLHIEDFDIEKLIDYLSYYSNTDRNEVKKKNHIDYFQSYLQSRNVKKMLVEYPYVDKDYLEDYSAYYARSFAKYGKQTIRLHFFSKEYVDHTLINEFLANTPQGGDSSLFNDGYEGYMVVKPIPVTMIGKTVLKTYPGNEQGRIYPITRAYNANIFGLQLNLDSIGYQEQDKTVAACATSALWSVFQSTGLLFQHSIPSPAEITRLATENSYYVDRAFPNKGLSLEQIANCIKSLKLEPQYQDVNEYQFLKAFINAYLHAKIPVLLGTSLYSMSKKDFLGEHAVAVMGFNKGASLTNLFGLGQKDKRLYLSASRIDKIFVHDDQIGPFARMEFDDPLYSKVTRIEHRGTKTHFASLSTSWKLSDEDNEIRSVPNIILVPLYHKIRIPFERIFSLISNVNVVINAAVEDENVQLIDEWDIVLDINRQFKSAALAETSFIGEEKSRILIKSLPRFIWRAKAYKEEELVFEILFDATDIIEGKLFLEAICYDTLYCQFLQGFLEMGTDLNLIKDRHARYCIGELKNAFSRLLASRQS